MLTLRPEQMEALGAYSRQIFLRQIARYLRHHHPESLAHLSDAELHSTLDQSCVDAARYDIRREYDLQRLLILGVDIGFAWASNPESEWVRAILEQQDRIAADRLDELEQTLAKRKADK